MAVTVGTITTVSGSRSSVADAAGFAHTNDGDCLLVGAAQGYSEGGVNVVTAVSYNGVALTKIGEVPWTSGQGVISVWRLLNPAAGSHTVAITHNGDLPVVYTAVSLSGVHQTTPEGTVVTASGSSATASATVTSAGGELVVDFAAVDQDNGATATVGSGQTQRTNVSSALGLQFLDVLGLVSTEPGAGSVTMDWSLSPVDAWKTVAVPVKPATGGTPNTQSVAGAITPTGAVTEILLSLNTLQGAITPTGALTAQKVSSLRTQSVSGAITPSGALVTVTNPSAGGGNGLPMRLRHTRTE